MVKAFILMGIACIGPGKCGDPNVLYVFDSANACFLAIKKSIEIDRRENMKGWVYWCQPGGQDGQN